MSTITPDADVFSLSSAFVALERSSDAILVTDADRRILYANRSAESLCQKNRRDLKGLVLTDLLQPLSVDHRTIVPLVDQLPASVGETVSGITPRTVRRTDGSVVPLDVTLTKIDEGYLYQLISLSTLREIERHVVLQANLLDHVHESIIATDLAGTILYWNDIAESLYGWTSTEAIGRHVVDVVVPPSRKEAAKQTFGEWNMEGSYEGEFIEVRKDGSEFLSHVRITEVKDWQNNRIGFIGLAHDLTAERATQNELKQTISLLHATLQATEDGILVVDNHGRISAWNEQFIRMWRIPESVIVSGSDEAALEVALEQLEDPSTFLSKVQELYASPEDDSFDVLTLKDGRIFERISRPQRIDSASVGRVWSFRDVTVRYIAQYELAEQKSLYESLITAQSDLGEGFAIASPTKILFTNDAVERITGYTREDLNALDNFLAFVHPEERPRIGEQLQRRLRGEQVPDHYESRILHKHGRVIDVELAVKLRHVNELPELVIIFRDITLRKEIERSLVASEAKFRTVVDNLGEAIVITDIEDRILYMNARLEELSGYSISQCIGRPGHKLMLPESEWPKALNRLERRKAGKNESYELLFRHKNGELRWCFVNAVPYYNLDGKIVGTVAAITDIHEKKQTEIELRRAEERFRFMTLATNDVVYDWVFDTNEIWWNEAFNRLLKIDRNEPVNLDAWSQRVHPDDLQRVTKGLQSAVEQRKQVWSDEYRIRKQDGTYADIVDRGYVVFDDTGSPVRMIGAMMDVTDRKRAENEIRKAAANTAALIENTTDAILSLDRDLRLVTFNSSFQEIFRLHNGVNPYPGLELGEYFQKREADLWKSIFERVMQGEHFSIERRRTVGESDAQVFEMSFNPIRENNEVVGVAIFDKDITERKHVEEELKRSQANLRALIENTNDAIWSINTEKRLITYNTSFRRMFTTMFGVVPREGMKLDELIGHDHQGFWRECYELALAGTQYTTEYSAVLMGMPQYFEISFSPIYTDQVLRGVTIFTRNVTERKMMEHQLIEEKERAEEMSRLKSSFLANMSHEIRTPMTAILGFASIIREHSQSEELDKYANTIERSGARLLATINGILDLAKIEANKIDLRQQLLDPKAEIEKLAEFYRSMAHSKGLTLETSLEETGKIVADEHYLGQVLTNLIGNALKFTPTGSIHIELTNEAESIVIRVIDTGIGISPEFLPHIFDEFKQESGGYGRNYEGSGLGLTITKRLVELMNGSIEAVSVLDRGSEFTLRFPHATREELSEDNQQSDMQKEHSMESPAEGSVPKILLVEDTSDTAEMVRIFMRGKCHLEFARSAAEALERISEYEFDLLLMDVNLGEGPSGLEVTREIRTKRSYAKTPIIALTAFAMKGDRESALAAGCNDYLSKPFTKAELLRKVSQFLEK